VGWHRHQYRRAVTGPSPIRHREYVQLDEGLAVPGEALVSVGGQ
jgi:hypothetical protein